MHKGGIAEAGTSRNTITTRLVTMWPSLPYLSFGLWSAWSALAFSGALWLSDIEKDGTYLSMFYTLTTICCALGMIVGAVLSARGHEEFISSDRAVMGGGALAGLSCLTIVIIGPFYLGQFFESTLAMFYIASVAAGFGSSLIGLRCGYLYGHLPPRKAIIYACLSQLLAAFVYSMVVLVPDWAPIAHGPTLFSTVALCLLPMLAALLGCVKPVVGRGDDQASVEPPVPFKATGSIGRFFVFSFCISFITAILRSDVVTTHALASTIAGNNLIVILKTIVALILIVYAVNTASHGEGLGRVCSLVAVTSALLTACVAAIGGLTNALSILVYVAAAVFELIMWCLLAFIVAQRRFSSYTVFGLGRGVFMLGSGVGWGLGSTLLSFVEDSMFSSVFFLVCAGVMLLLALCLFSERDYQKLFSAAGSDDLSLEDLFDAEKKKKRPSEDDATVRRAPFRETVEDISRQYGLSARESEVFRYIAMGYGSDRIADTLQVTVNTVRAHTRNVYTKLDVHSREEIMRLVDDQMAR